MQIKVNVDVEGALKGLDDLEREYAPRATVAALNKVGVTARTEAARQISAETGLPVSQVKKYVPLVKANKWTLSAVISALPWAPNLARFSARQTKQGVSANAWRQRKIYRGTFLGNQGRTAFKRVGKARLPIEPVHGPSVPRTFIGEKTQAAIQRVVRERFALEFSRALQQFLRSRR